MARSLHLQAVDLPGRPDLSRQALGQAERNVFFRALVDLGTGGVAGIEAAQERLAHINTVTSPQGGPVDPILSSSAEPLGAWGAWGHEVREPAAYLVRGGLSTRPERVGQALGLDPARIIIMFDVPELLGDPLAALELLVAGKRAGTRILLDNFDMEDPPARFMEMLPADILRVDPTRMPWHWDDARRREALESLLSFAGNLLMDVAVEGVDNGGQSRAFKRLGVRYAQGGWRRDALGLVPDPARF
jgi:hypothetical protein